MKLAGGGAVDGFGGGVDVSGDGGGDDEIEGRVMMEIREVTGVDGVS